MRDRTQLIGTVLAQVAGLGRELTRARTTPFGDDLRLSRSQLDALFVLAHSTAPATPGSLATALGVTPGAVTQLVDGLRTHGLVETLPHPADGRARIVRLTPGARESVDGFEHAAVERMAPRFSRLSTAQLQQLGELLQHVGADTAGDES